MESKGKNTTDLLEQALGELEAQKRKVADKKLDAPGLKHATTAPPPITPSRASSYVRPKPKDERLPRWSKWRLMPTVEQWEAVALWLNIEPDKIKTDGNAWMGRSHPFDEGEEFDDRLSVLQANSNRTNFPTPCKLNMGKWYKSGVRLDEFAAWALSVAEWDIPDELKAIAAKVAPPMPANEPVTAMEKARPEQEKSLNELFPHPENSPLYQRECTADEQAVYERAGELWDKKRDLQRQKNKWERMEHKNDPQNEILIEENLAKINAEIAEVDELIRELCAPEIEPDTAPPSPANVQVDCGDWKAKARAIADECFDSDTKNNCRDSLNGYSKRVMKKMQERGIKGPRGNIDNFRTVMRDALQGDKWWVNKIK